jgi:hypothetical protein
MGFSKVKASWLSNNENGELRIDGRRRRYYVRQPPFCPGRIFSTTTLSILLLYFGLRAKKSDRRHGHFGLELRRKLTMCDGGEIDSSKRGKSTVAACPVFGEYYRINPWAVI